MGDDQQVDEALERARSAVQALRRDQQSLADELRTFERDIERARERHAPSH